MPCEISLEKKVYLMDRAIKFMIPVVLMVLVGCQAAPVVKEQVKVEPLKKVIIKEEPVFTAEPGLSNQQRLRKSIRLLELGNGGQARAELEAYLVDIPKSKIANFLLMQITAPLDELFPEQYQEISLPSGETISTIAKQYLGNALQFYALARYNDFEEPGKLQIGQLIRVPLTAEAREHIAALETKKSEQADETIADGELPQSDQEAEAVASQPEEGDLVEEDLSLGTADGMVTIGEEEFALSRTEFLAVLLADGQNDELIEEFEKTGSTEDLDKEFLGGLASVYSESADSLRIDDEELAASRYLAAGELLIMTGDREQAVKVLQSSVQLNPDNTDAESLFSKVSSKLIDEYHSDASRAFRRQELDSAIILWEWILSVDPFHQHALDYLIRAQELKEKIDKFR